MTRRQADAAKITWWHFILIPECAICKPKSNSCIFSAAVRPLHVSGSLRPFLLPWVATRVAKTVADWSQARRLASGDQSGTDALFRLTQGHAPGGMADAAACSADLLEGASGCALCADLRERSMAETFKASCAPHGRLVAQSVDWTSAD